MSDQKASSPPSRDAWAGEDTPIMPEDSPLGGAEETTTSYKWSHREMVRLIDLWVKEQCLWKTLIPEYKDKIHQLGALKRIQKCMEEAEAPAPGVTDISAKITGLKLYYMSTKLEREDMIKQGSREEDLPVILMPYYKMLQFLNEADDPPPPAQIHTAVQASGPEGEGGGVASIHTSSNPDDVFCSYMAILLKEIEDGRLKEKLKVDVQAVIFRARFPEEELLIAPAAHALNPQANPMNPYPGQPGHPGHPGHTGHTGHTGHMANVAMNVQGQPMSGGNHPMNLGNQPIGGGNPPISAIKPSMNAGSSSMNVGNQSMNTGHPSVTNSSMNVGTQPSVMMNPSVNAANPSLNMRNPQVHQLPNPSMNPNQMNPNQMPPNQMNPQMVQSQMNPNQMNPSQPTMATNHNMRPQSKYATRYTTQFPGASRFDQSNQQLNSAPI